MFLSVPSTSYLKPCFGMDIGGTLVKFVYFQPVSTDVEYESKFVDEIDLYLNDINSRQMRGKRDAHLLIEKCKVNGQIGNLHFIRFPTSEISSFLEFAKEKMVFNNLSKPVICLTGGGSYKFEKQIKEKLPFELRRFDELDSLIHGIHFTEASNPDECYYLSPPYEENNKMPFNITKSYPFLVVNIGSGVSILAVYSEHNYRRVSGTSLGGGTFLGLCCLLAGCETFEEAISLAKMGDSTKVDKLVKDIYGGDYPKFGLTGDTIASSFGNMSSKERRENASREDLCRASLVTITNNIGSIARMCALNENINKVIFVGNFLRVNQISMKMLAYAMDFWSKGTLKAVFLKHEGYFGAVGCMLEQMKSEKK